MSRDTALEYGLALTAIGLLCLALVPIILKAKAAFALIAFIERGLH